MGSQRQWARCAVAKKTRQLAVLCPTNATPIVRGVFSNVQVDFTWSARKQPNSPFASPPPVADSPRLPAPLSWHPCSLPRAAEPNVMLLCVEPPYLDTSTDSCSPLFFAPYVVFYFPLIGDLQPPQGIGRGQRHA